MFAEIPFEIKQQRSQVNVSVVRQHYYTLKEYSKVKFHRKQSEMVIVNSTATKDHFFASCSNYYFSWRTKKNKTSLILVDLGVHSK